MGPPTLIHDSPGGTLFPTRRLQSVERHFMLTIFNQHRADRMCDGLSRRDFLRVGALGIGGLTLAGLLLLPHTGWAQPTSPLETYRRLEYPPKDENFAKGWQERVALEYEIINAADRKALRSALKDEDPFVRAIAARALGILGDKDSADALAELVKADKEYFVRLRQGKRTTKPLTGTGL